MSARKASTKVTVETADVAEAAEAAETVIETAGTAEAADDSATIVTAETKENTVYVGPTLTGIIRHSTVFKGGKYPGRVNACLEQMPAMKRLFVPLGELPEANKELSKDQSALKTLSAQVAKKFARR